MMWDDWEDFQQDQNLNHDQDQDSFLNFDFLSLVSQPKDYYKVLELDYDASDDAIRSNYIRLALKWHPDKQKNQDSATSRFQEINEAYHDGLAGLIILN
ncbi:dnaJ homolog subfamily B member 3 isoform X2 [Manihot esculenta]|uniref:dnaJ homolog subfamily B member 3 isoform X2 n=1 Tax=Manihot esculenta TaxID=3983 RepID=UPI000B5D35DF|nr:dnaJ homolog subfamily B member 3 isoform X2 [Manihot esculenta]